jgi:arylformamidase
MQGNTATPVYKGLTREDIEAQYFLRGTRPDYQSKMIPDWIERSSRLRNDADCSLDVSYGPGTRNRLDFFRAGSTVRGFVLYIHGGYWQRGDKSVYSYIAAPYVRRGFSVALMNYHMCPEVALSAIAPQARRAVAWLWRNADEFGIPRDNFNVMGHSAGGHLTAEMLLTDWRDVDTGMPLDVIRSAVALSGIYDLEPLLHCSENAGLGLTTEEAARVSPIHQRLVSACPQLIAYGSNEPRDMHRQSIDYSSTFRSQGAKIELYAIPGADHFDVCNVIADDDSELFSKCMDIMSR